MMLMKRWSDGRNWSCRSNVFVKGPNLEVFVTDQLCANRRNSLHLASISPTTQPPKMCGIHAVISHSASPSLEQPLRTRLCSRGPDHLGTVAAQLPNASVTFTSTVLALRGDHVAKQPLVDESTGSVLCWNGEAWKIEGEELEVNDTDAVFELLVQASRRRVEGDADPVLEAMRGVEGPFALVFFDKPARRVYFGRDRLGRRSLLMSKNGGLTLSSIAETTSDAWSEVEADGFYYVALDQITGDEKMEATKLSWTKDEDLVGREHFIAATSILLLTRLGFEHRHFQHVVARLIIDVDTRIPFSEAASWAFDIVTTATSLEHPATSFSYH